MEVLSLLFDLFMLVLVSILATSLVVLLMVLVAYVIDPRNGIRLYRLIVRGLKEKW